MYHASRAFTVAVLLVAMAPLAFAQGARRTDNPNHVAGANAVAATAPVNSTEGGVTVYTSRTTFNTDNPGLPTEDFEEASPELACTAFDGPVSSTTSHPPFYAPGDILPGVTFSTTPVVSPDIFIADTGCFDATSYLLGNNNNTADFVMTFSPAVAAVGFDVDLDNFGNTTTIEALDAGNNVLGSTTLSGLNIVFRGFGSSTANIARVVVRSSLSTEWIEVDNVSFGGSTGCQISFNSASLSPTTIAPGATFNVNVDVRNDGPSAPVTLQLVATGPANRTINLGTATLPPTNSVTRSIAVRTPANAPSGTYTITLNLISNTVECDSEVETLVITAPRVGNTSGSGEFEVVAPFAVTADAVTTTAVASPNPFAGQTAIRFGLDASANVRLSVYDVLGRQVAVLVDGTLEAGQHTATFDARGLSSGTYVYRLVTGASVQTGRITLAN